MVAIDFHSIFFHTVEGYTVKRSVSNILQNNLFYAQLMK